MLGTSKLVRSPLLVCLCLYAGWSVSLAQEIPSEPEIRLSLNEQLNLVLSANGVSTPGIDIQSPSGSLVPLPGDDFADPRPFNILLANTPNQITFGNIGSTVTIDGNLTLDARWNPGGERDISYQYAQGPTPIGPYEIDPAAYDQCPDCLPQIGVSLTEDQKFKLSGVGQRLNSLSLNSRSGSLLPGESAAPFAGFGSNTNKLVEFNASDSPVVLDGDVTLNVGWNDYVGGRDVRYTYDTDADGVQGPLLLDVNAYPPRPFVPGQLNAYVDANDKLVVVGTGHPLRRLSFGSDSGSLVPAPDAGPFAALGENNESKIDFVSPSRGSEVILEGSLQLGAGWNPSGERDIQFDYAIAGDARDDGLFRIPNANYLDATSNPSSIRRPEQRPRFDLKLNSDGKFVVSSDGRSLQSLQIASSSGSLVPAESAAPFQQALLNDKNAIFYQSFGDEVQIDGDVTLSSGWDVTTPDIAYAYFSRDGSGIGFEMDELAYTACSTCPIPRIRVSLNDQQNFVLTGQGHQLANLKIASPELSALIPATSAAPFASLGENSGSLVEFGAAEGSPVILDGSVTLSAGWDIREAGEDLQISYDLADRATSESFPLPSRSYPDTPRYATVLVNVNEDNKFVLQGRGQPLIDFTLTSVTNSLVPAETAEPFQELGENTTSRIEYASPTSLVTLDGELTLSAGWNPIRPKQVQYEYSLFERSKQVTRRTVPNRNYPARVTQISDELRMELDDEQSVVITGNNVSTAGIDILSASGSLIPGEDPAPFEFHLSNTPEQVTLGSLGQVTIDGTVTLDVKWDENGRGDIFYFFGDGAENKGPFEMLPQEYQRRQSNCLTCDIIGDSLSEGDFGFAGGASLVVQDEKVWIRTTSPIAMSGLDLVSPAGRLVPVPEEVGAQPFTFFLSNTANQITWGNLGSSVVIDGDFFTNAGYVGDPTGDLTASWGNGASPVSVPVLGDGGGFGGGGGAEFSPTEPAFVDLSEVSLDITDRQTLAIRGTGQAISQLNVRSASGGLVPNKDGESGAGPFLTLEEVVDSEGQLLLFATGSVVVLDGTLDLGVGWHEEFDGSVDEFRENLFTDVTAEVSTPGGQVSSIGFYEPVDVGFDVRLNEAGQLVLIGTGQAITGIDITSASGSLLPNASGDLAADAGPFTFFLSNNENQITYGNLGASVTLDEIVLDVGIDAADLASSDLVISIGIGPEIREIRFGGNEVIPEPESFPLVCLGVVVVVSCVRPRRRSKNG